MAKWDSKQYLKFEKARTQPAIDLANRIETKNPQKILDLGCGPGNSTNTLKKRFPEADILGVDNSVEMIETVKIDYPNLEFAIFDATQDFSSFGHKFDIIYSNACIQWVPNHPDLLKRLIDALNPEGSLAIQLPLTVNAPMHQILANIVKTTYWKKYFSVSPRIFYTLKTSEYFDILSSFPVDFTMWETLYHQNIPNHSEVLEWYRGTGLRPYLAAIPKEEQSNFEAEILERVVAHYPIQRNGEIIFTMSRLFFVAKLI